MTSCADILGKLSRSRLEGLAVSHAPDVPRDLESADIADALEKAAGDRLLEMLSELDDNELADICDQLELEPGELARLVAPPRTRGDCIGGLRPCPYRTCRYRVDEGPEPVCSLDIAAYGGATLEEVSATMGIQRDDGHNLRTSPSDRSARAQALEGSCGGARLGVHH